MRWFRSNRRSGGLLALFALALQLTLAFAHVHVRDGGGWPAGVAVAKAPTSSHANDSRGSGAPHGGADIVCDICATLAITSAAQVSAPPQIAVAAYPTAIRFAAIDDLALRAARERHFQSRAPPAA